MPIFEYQCGACGHEFEEIVRGDANPPACPKCGAEGAIKKISLPGASKKGGFPFKPGPVHPLASRMAGGCGACGGNGGNA